MLLGSATSGVKGSIFFPFLGSAAAPQQQRTCHQLIEYGTGRCSWPAESASRKRGLCAMLRCKGSVFCLPFIQGCSLTAQLVEVLKRHSKPT